MKYTLFFIHNALLFNHASFCTCIKALFCRKKNKKKNVATVETPCTFPLCRAAERFASGVFAALFPAVPNLTFSPSIAVNDRDSITVLRFPVRSHARPPIRMFFFRVAISPEDIRSFLFLFVDVPRDRRLSPFTREPTSQRAYRIILAEKRKLLHLDM